MATVAVPAAWIALGTLPTCCARHGRPATGQARRRFDTKTPSWVLLLCLVAVLIAAVVALALRKSVEGTLPVCDECAAEQRRFKLTVVGAWAADVVVLVLAAQLGVTGLLIWLLATLAALVWSFGGGQRYRVTGFLRKDQMWVDLRGVSDEFAAAINAVVRPEQPVAVPPQPVVAPPQPVAVALQPVAVAPQPVAEAQTPVVAAEPASAVPLHSGLATRPTILPKL
jgi:hypothetical protein